MYYPLKLVLPKIGLGLVLAFFARPRPRLTVPALSKNMTKPAVLLRLIRTENRSIGVRGIQCRYDYLTLI